MVYAAGPAHVSDGDVKPAGGATEPAPAGVISQPALAGEAEGEKRAITRENGDREQDQSGRDAARIAPSWASKSRRSVMPRRTSIQPSDPRKPRSGRRRPKNGAASTRRRCRQASRRSGP